MFSKESSSVSGLVAETEELTARLYLSSQQIRKLRRELEASQDKVANLTSQLSANVCTDMFQTPAAHLVCGSLLTRLLSPRLAFLRCDLFILI